MPSWLLASWNPRSIQCRCPCIYANSSTLVSLGAFVHDTLISPSSISRATIRRPTGGALRSSHTHTSPTQTLAPTSPLLVLRITTPPPPLANPAPTPPRTSPPLPSPSPPS